MLRLRVDVGTIGLNAEFRFAGSAHSGDRQPDGGHEEQHRSQPGILATRQRPGLGRGGPVAQTARSLRQRRFRTRDVSRPRDVLQHK